MDEWLRIGAVAVFLTRAYSLGCDAPNQHTASGTVPRTHQTIAADPSIPFGSVLHIAGIGPRYVQDRGSAIRGNVLDIFVESCAAAKEWGIQPRTVAVLHVGGSNDIAFRPALPPLLWLVNAREPQEMQAQKARPTTGMIVALIGLWVIAAGLWIVGVFRKDK